MYSRVVAPLDGSTLALQVLPYARLIAESTGATLVLLNSVNSFPADLIGLTAWSDTDTRVIGAPGLPERSSDVGSTPTPEQLAELRGRVRADSERQLDEAAGPARAQGLKVEIVLKEGDPAEMIAEEADKDEQTLIAMSTHGRSGVGRWLMGSVTDRVVRHGRHATLVIRAQEGDVTSSSPKLRRVLLPVDGSSISDSAVPHGVEMAKAIGCGITVLRVVSPMAYGEAFADYVPTVQSDAFVASIQAEAQGYVDSKVAEIQAAGIADVEGKIVEGNPGSVIIDEVGQGGEQLVVMATHGRSGVGRWLMGSVTDRVIRHSAGPVLVIRP